MTHTSRITTVTDAARARVATVRAAAAYGVPPLERARLATALSARLRQCLTEGGTWTVVLGARSPEGTRARCRSPWPRPVARGTTGNRRGGCP